MDKIEENFLDIYNCIYEKAGINLHQKYLDSEISLSGKKIAPLECYNIEEKYIKEFKDEYKSLSHIRISPATKGYMYTTSNRDKLVAIINTENKDGVIWIQALEIFGEFKRTGMGLGLLDIAVKDLNATHLSVNKKNKVAMKLYLQYGFEIYDKTDKMHFMSIKNNYNESYALSERSHGNLKYSFRMGINVDNGHIVKIVFDLKTDDIDLVGSHDDTHPVKEEDQEKIRKRIRKTGYTDFTSTGKILAIVDMDTGKRLQTVNATGVMSGLQSFASKPLKEREKLAKDESSALHGFKTFTVGQKEGDGKRRPWSYATYKSTRPAKELDDLSKFQNDPVKYGRGYMKENRDFLYESEDIGNYPISKIGENPQEIYKWMKSNISYGESSNWVLKNPSDTIESASGNCHDQSLLTKTILDHLGYRAGQLFFIEYKSGTNVGGKTHTLTWYNENNQYYWMETAWEDQSNIHGPYSSINDIKKDIVNIYNENIDNEYDGLVFGSNSTYETGMNLYEYVESWDCQDDYGFEKSRSKLIEEAFNEIELIVNSGDINVQEYDPPLSYDKLPEHLKNDEVHSWRAKTGIELIHREPSLDELNRIWNNWQLMTDEQKSISEKKSIELFGITNEEHYKKLLPLYDEGNSLEEPIRPNGIYTTSDLIKNINTPDELLDWMKCIDYGWIDKSGRINGTDDNDETSHLYNEYRLQSPNQTIRNKVGLCWDQVELERVWFDHHIKEYVYAVIYVEVQNEEDCPTHTFLIYKECGGTDEVNWFESSWKDMAGIKHYKNLNECLTDAVGKVIESFNTDGRQIIRLLNKPMKPNITCEEYYQIASSSFEVDMGDLFYDEIFNESQHSILENGEEDNEYFEILKSDIDKDFRHKGHKSLSKFTRKRITNELAKKYKNDGKLIGKLKAHDSRFSDECYLWIDDKDNYVGAVTFDSTTDKNGHSWISGLDVAYKYQGYGIGKQLLNYAVKSGANALTVQYDNEIAIKMYKNYGFEISKESKELMDKKKHVTYDMFLTKGIKESFDIMMEALDDNEDDKTENENDDNMPDDIDDKDIDEEIPSIEDEEISTDEDESDILSDEIEEPAEDKQQEAESEEKKEEQKPLSMPKQTDRAESDKNGVRRKKLYIAFIEWAKAYNDKNTFGSLFDKDIFHVTYPFVPEEMRYFYRLANPILCVLAGDLTFFQVSELRKLNAKNNKLTELMIFAATPNDTRVFSAKDKKVYRGTDENGQIKLNECLGDTFDTYIQNMIKKGDILNGPIEDKTDEPSEESDK